MIKFRQKNFFLPALVNGALIGGTFLGLKQGADQARDAERQSQETQEALDRQTRALNKIAKEARNNPQIARQVVEQKQMSDTERIKLFAAPNPGLVKNVTGFAKDLWGTQKGNIMRAGKMGLGIASAGYLGNRITTSLKDHDEGHDERNKSFLGKAALTGAAIAGTYAAAKRGKLGNAPIKALNGKTGSQAIQTGMEKIGKAVNPIQRKANGKIDKLGTSLNTVFVATPVMGYLGQRKQQKDQANQTLNAKTYSDNDGSTKKKVLGTLGTLGATAGSIALARRGTFGTGAQKFIGNVTAGTGGLLKSAGAKKIGTAMAKEGSRTYGTAVAKSQGLTDKASIAKFTRDRYRSAAASNQISGGINKVGSFFGFYGKGGTNAVQNTANKLANSESGSTISKGVGEFMKKHRTAANLIATGGTVAAGGTIMSASNKPFKVFDSHAYDYEKQQEKQV